MLVFLGIPLLAGFLTRTLGEKAKGRDWYEGTFLPRLGPWALYGLLFTIMLLFALQGDDDHVPPLDVVRIALPLLVYFVVIFGAGMLLGKWLDLGYRGPPPWPSPPPATTSNSPSPWRSALSASRPARPWPASSAP